MKKTILFLIIAMIVSSMNVYAFTLSIEPVNNKIYPDEEASYVLRITNTDTTTHRYTFGISGDVRWILDTIPVVATVGANETVEVEVTITPKKSALLSGTLGYGGYNIPLYVKEQETGIYRDISVFVYIASYYLPGIEYKPIIRIIPEYESSIDPREPFILGLTISNKNIINVTGLEIRVSSDLFTKDLEMDLSPLETKHVELVFELDPLSSPGLHKFIIEALYENESLVYDERNLQIIEYKDISIDKSSSIVGFLVKKTVIYVKNNGNSLQEVLIPYKTWIGKEILSSHPGITTRIIDGEKEKGFLLELSPGEERDIVIKTHYWPLLILGLLIIISIILYYLLRSPIVVKKEARAISRGEGVSEIKVTLRVRNRSMKPVFKLLINDFVPKIASIDRQQKFIGTTPPTRIAKHEGLGERITWEIEVMEPYEERLLTYKIKTKLDVLGSMTLPRAKIRFETKKGVRVVNSNPARI